MVLYLAKDKRMVLQERPECRNPATMLVMVKKPVSKNDHIYIHMGRYSPQWYLPSQEIRYSQRYTAQKVSL